MNLDYENMSKSELIEELKIRFAYIHVEDVIRLYQGGDVIGAIQSLEVAFPELAGLSGYLSVSRCSRCFGEFDRI
jgi:hypothetical protein